MGSYSLSAQPKKPNVRVVDSGINWVMALACLLIQFILLGINRINGILFVDYLSTVQVSREMASWPFSISGAADILVAPLCGILSKKLSARIVCVIGCVLVAIGCLGCFFSLDLYYVSVFYGLIRGAGQVLATNMFPQIINQNFQIHRASAFGIVTGGTPLATFVFPALTQYCLEEYGLKGTFLLLSGIAFHSCIGGTILKLQRQENSIPTIIYVKNTNNEENYVFPIKNASNECGPNDETNLKQTNLETSNKAILRHILSTPQFYFLLVTYMAVMNFTYTYTLVAVDYAIDKGVSKNYAFWILTSYSVGELFGRMGLGWVTDKKLISRQNFAAIQLIISGSCLILLTFTSTFSLVLVVSVFIGLTQGTLLSTTTILVMDYMRPEAVTWTVSINRAGSGVLLLVRSPIIGYFRDELGSYDGLLQIISGISICIGVLWFLEQIYTKLKTKINVNKL